MIYDKLDKKKNQQLQGKKNKLELLIERAELDEHGNILLEAHYYTPQRTPITTDDRTPHIIWDYNLGRLTSIQGFFSVYSPDVIVVGSTIANPDKVAFVIEHETEHRRRNRTNAPQDEYAVDIATKKKTGQDPYNRWGYGTR